MADRDPATRGHVECRNWRKRKHRRDNGHVPATRTSGLLTVVFQRASTIVDGMLVDRAVRMNVGNGVALCMLMSRMLLAVAVVVMAVRTCCGMRDEGPLNGERQRGRHHDDVGAPSK